MRLLDGAREVRAHLEALQIADDQQRRVLQCLAIVEELLVGRGQVLALALVLPGEVTALPDIGEAAPPPVFSIPFSKAYQSPMGSATLGVA